MNIQTQSVIETPYSIPTTTRLGRVHLTVANLDRQIKFYENVLGMQLRWREGASAGLGTGEADLLRLTEVRGARRPRGATGLYHFALRYPNRKALARATARLFALRYPNAPTDHTISESIYLDDPEGQTVELYILTLQRGTITAVDGSLSVRRSDGKPATGRDPLDLEDLLGELGPEEPLGQPLPQGTTLGHVNLWAASLADEMHFYHDVLGFQKGPVAANYGMGEVGLSADQPHIIPFNTWHGADAPTPPPNSLGMRYFTIELPDQAELGRVLERVQLAGLATEDTEMGRWVRDPAGQDVVLTTADGSKAA